MIFDGENGFWKSNFGTFWHLPNPNNPILKIQQFPLGMLILLQKILILYPPLENFTTCIAIMDIPMENSSQTKRVATRKFKN